MTREAEKQKSIFRKLSQGGKETSQKHSKPSHTSIDHSPKKTLSHAPEKALHESKHVETHVSGKHEDSHSAHASGKHEDSHSTHASGKHEDSHSTHASGKHEDSHSTHASDKHKDTHATHAPGKHEDSHTSHAPTHASGHDAGHGSGDDSHSIFKGFSGEAHKADKRVFKKKKHKTYAYGDSTSLLSRVLNFVQNKWYSSRIHKIWICAAGYIFATQAWLCVVAFFCVIIWRIRDKA